MKWTLVASSGDDKKTNYCSNLYKWNAKKSWRAADCYWERQQTIVTMPLLVWTATGLYIHFTLWIPSEKGLDFNQWQPKIHKMKFLQSFIFFICLNGFLPIGRKEAILSLKNFASRPGLALMVTPLSRESYMGTEKKILSSR